MSGSLGAKLGISTLAMLSIGLAACGSDTAARTSSTSDAGVTSSTHATTPGLERFLLMRGEEPGYQPSGSAATISDVTEYAAGEGRAQSDLREEGFDRVLYRQLLGTDS